MGYIIFEKGYIILMSVVGYLLSVFGCLLLVVGCWLSVIFDFVNSRNRKDYGCFLDNAELAGRVKNPPALLHHKSFNFFIY